MSDSTIKIKTLPTGPIQTNTYIVWAEGEDANRDCWIIDPGGLARSVVAEVEQRDLQPKLLVITHGHWDHFLGNKGVKDHWPDIEIVVHEADAPALPDPNVNMSIGFFGSGGGLAFPPFAPDTFGFGGCGDFGLGGGGGLGTLPGWSWKS